MEGGNDRAGTGVEETMHGFKNHFIRNVLGSECRDPNGNGFGHA